MEKETRLMEEGWREENGGEGAKWTSSVQPLGSLGK